MLFLFNAQDEASGGTVDPPGSSSPGYAGWAVGALFAVLLFLIKVVPRG